MTEQETTIFNRIAGYLPDDVKTVHEKQGDYEGTIVLVTRTEALPMEFFFPDYAGMSDAEMAEVVANNLKEEKWTSLKP